MIPCSFSHAQLLRFEGPKEVRWRGRLGNVSWLFVGEHYFTLVSEGPKTTRMLHGARRVALVGEDLLAAHKLNAQMQPACRNANTHASESFNRSLRQVQSAAQCNSHSPRLPLRRRGLLRLPGATAGSHWALQVHSAGL